MPIERVTCVPKHSEKRRKQWRDHRESKLESLTPEELAQKKEEKRIYDKAYRAKNKKPKAKWRKKYRKRANQLQNARYRRLHPNARPPKMTPAQKRKVSRDYRKRNIHRIRARERAYYHANKPKFKEWGRDYYQRNAPQVIARNGARTKEYRKDPRNRIIFSFYSVVNRYLRGKGKSLRTMQLVGCSRAELIAHLEKQFVDGMCWDNYGFFGWHVDHIRPLSSHNLCDPEEQKRAFNFRNLRPLWWRDNVSKNDFLPDGTRARDLKKLRSLNTPSEVLSKGA